MIGSFFSALFSMLRAFAYSLWGNVWKVLGVVLAVTGVAYFISRYQTSNPPKPKQDNNDG